MEPLMVSVECLVFNHKDYLRNCLDGIVKQRTNFRFEAVVHDDASIDGSSEIIKEYAGKYPEIIKPIIEKENLYSKHDGSLQKVVESACTGKYLAYCEGDDYWTDPQKLQKQVDFLESHPEYGMCYTDFDIQDDTKKEYRHALFQTEPLNFPKQFNLEKWILNASYVAPMTWVVRRELWDKRPPIITNDGTFVLFAGFLLHSKVYCLDDVTATYRIAMGSLSHSTSIDYMYQRINGLFRTQLRLLDYCKKHVENYKETEAKIYEKYYKAFFIIVQHGDEAEIEEAIQRLGNNLTTYQHLLLILRKIPFAMSLLTKMWERKYNS